MSTDAGWYPDPHARHELRYWDGTTWTEHVSDEGVTSTDAAIPSGVGEPTAVVPPVEAGAPTIADEAVEGSSKRSLPVAAIVGGIAVLALLIGGIVWLLSRNEDDDSLAEGLSELTVERPVAEYSNGLGSGDGVRFLADQVVEELDPVVIVVTDRGDAVDMARQKLGDREEGMDDEAVLDEFGLETLDESELLRPTPGDYGVDGGDIVLGRVDSAGTGGAEAGYFITPADGDVRFLVHDVEFDTGEVEFRAETREGGDDPDDRSAFDDGWTDDEGFFGDADVVEINPFGGSSGGLLDDLGDQFGDLFGEDFDFGNLEEEFGDLFGDGFNFDELDGFGDQFGDLFGEDFDFGNLEEEFGDLFGDGFNFDELDLEGFESFFGDLFGGDLNLDEFTERFEEFFGEGEDGA